MWHIKKSSGDVYGPVELQTLQVWAMDGRVAPEDELSADGSSWTPASDMKELAMDWLVEFEDGSTYGPVHLLALRDPVRQGTIPLESRIRHRERDETTTVGAVLLTPLLEWDAERTEQLSQLNEKVEDLRGELDAAQPGDTDKPPETAPTTVSAPDPAVLAERDALKKQVEELRSELTKAQEAGTANDAKPAEGAPEGYAELVQNFDELLDRYKENTEAVQAALDTRDKAEQLSAERVRQAEELAGRERQEARKAVERFTTLEQKHLQLLKSYRDLNDRMIQSRTRTEPKPAEGPKKPARGRR